MRADKTPLLFFSWLNKNLIQSKKEVALKVNSGLVVISGICPKSNWSNGISITTEKREKNAERILKIRLATV
jgi:hypothetical protein